MKISEHSAKIIELNCCIIIPTYNNDKTLDEVINELLAITDRVIIVNDGSTDTTKEILENYTALQIIHLAQNKGKGFALRTAFKYAIEKGYRYAITIDSDGQHFAKDIFSFLEKVEQEPDSLIIGARNLNQENMPGKNSFANKFSNFWFKIQTGITLPDTQSGFRLYPLQKLKNISFFSTKYEFEIEVLVKASWQEIKLCAIPISVYYAPPEERISHFRPGMDFTRISILNTYLVTLALVWYKPKNVIKNFSLKNIKTFVQTHFFDPSESSIKKSMSVAFGVFMGILPIWGYQLALAIAGAYIFKLNRAIVIVAANISLPPMIPLILYSSIKTGEIVLNTPATISFSSGITLKSITNNMYIYFAGATVLSVIMALLTGGLLFILLESLRRNKKELVKEI